MKRSTYRLLLTALLLAVLLLTLSGCGSGAADDSYNDASSGEKFEIPDSSVFEGKWVPASQNAMENAIEITNGKVTWYVWDYVKSSYIPMEEWVKQAVDGNEMVDSAEFSAELLGNQLSMKLTTTSFDGQKNEDPVIGTLLTNGDTLTLLLSGGSLGNQEDYVLFTRTDTPITEYTRDAG